MVLSQQVSRVQPEVPRGFEMALAYWPPSDVADSVVKAGVGATLENSEVVLVQVPWHPERTPAYKSSSWLAGVARQHGHGLLIALDWMEPTRDELLGRDWSFSDEVVRTQFVGDIRTLAATLQPERLTVGVEVDLLATKQPDEFRSFVTLYADVYDEVRAVSPDTRIGTSFQYEAMLQAGLVGNRFDTAGPIRAFGPLLDFVGLSLYPCLSYADVGDIPDDYLAPLEGVQQPISITETAWPAAGEDPSQQAAYLEWLASHSAAGQIDLLTWISTTDVGVYHAPQTGPACPASVGQWQGGLGLWTQSVQAKPAAEHWSTLLRTRVLSAGRLGDPKEDRRDPLTSPLY
jgi:hypothetical protein